MAEQFLVALCTAFISIAPFYLMTRKMFTAEYCAKHSLTLGKRVSMVVGCSAVLLLASFFMENKYIERGLVTASVVFCFNGIISALSVKEGQEK